MYLEQKLDEILKNSAMLPELASKLEKMEQKMALITQVLGEPRFTAKQLAVRWGITSACVLNKVIEGKLQGEQGGPKEKYYFTLDAVLAYEASLKETNKKLFKNAA